MDVSTAYPPASQRPSTISDLEQIIAGALEGLRPAPLSENITAAFPYLLPQGLRLRVQLEEDGRKKRSTAAASNWSPETGEIVIYFEPTSSAASATSKSSSSRIESNDGDMPELKAMPVHMDRAREQLAAEMPHWESLDPTQRNGYSLTRMSKLVDESKTQEITDSQIQQCCEALADAEKAGKSFIALKWFRDNDLAARGYSWVGSLEFRQAVLAKAIEVGAVVTSSIPNPKAPQHPTTTIKLNRESSYAHAVPPRYQPIRAKGGASASEVVLRDRGRF